MTSRSHQDLVLAIHPTARGFGWVCFESPLSPIDWGIASAKAGRNARLMVRFERLLSRYEPTIAVFEEFEQESARRSDRIRDLCRSMVHVAHIHSVETVVYSRSDVKTCFTTIGATTRYEIAQAIAQQIPAFRRRLPRQRRPWTSEDARQCLFDATAIAITHFAATKTSD